MQALLSMFHAVERTGRWPGAAGHVIIVLLTKAEGGFGPIGLFPSVVRIWMRIRLQDAVVWQTLHERPWLYASTAKGADVASWRLSARAELAHALGLDHAAGLYDLVKCFERVPHAILVAKARQHSYPHRPSAGLPRCLQARTHLAPRGGVL